MKTGLRGEPLSLAEHDRAAINLDLWLLEGNRRYEDTRLKRALLEELNFRGVWNRHRGRDGEVDLNNYVSRRIVDDLRDHPVKWIRCSYLYLAELNFTSKLLEKICWLHFVIIHCTSISL